MRRFVRIIHEESVPPFFRVSREVDDVEAVGIEAFGEGVVRENNLAVSAVIAEAAEEAGFEGSAFVFGEVHDGGVEEEEGEGVLAFGFEVFEEGEDEEGVDDGAVALALTGFGGVSYEGVHGLGADGGFGEAGGRRADEVSENFAEFVKAFCFPDGSGVPFFSFAGVFFFLSDVFFKFAEEAFPAFFCFFDTDEGAVCFEAGAECFRRRRYVRFDEFADGREAFIDFAEFGEDGAEVGFRFGYGRADGPDFLEGFLFFGVYGAEVRFVRIGVRREGRTAEGAGAGFSGEDVFAVFYEFEALEVGFVGFDEGGFFSEVETEVDGFRFEGGFFLKECSCFFRGGFGFFRDGAEPGFGFEDFVPEGVRAFAGGGDGAEAAQAVPVPVRGGEEVVQEFLSLRFVAFLDFVLDGALGAVEEEEDGGEERGFAGWFPASAVGNEDGRVSVGNDVF